MTVNKHGLSRVIPNDIKFKVRENDGYGCVICGSLIVEYEHIEPEFCNALAHNANCITLLCPTHHAQVTKKQISKNAIKKFKSSPYCIKHGSGKMQIYPNTEAFNIKIGSNSFSGTTIALMIHNKPMIWFETESDHILLNAIFYNLNNENIGYINKNEFIGLSKNYDIKIEGSEIQINSAKNKISLNLDINPEEPITFKRLKMRYNGVTVELDTDGSLIIKTPSSQVNLGGNTIHGCNTAFKIGMAIKYEHSIFNFYNGTKNTTLKALNKAFYINNFIPIFNLNLKQVGFIRENYIHDDQGFIRAYINKKLVYTLYDEYIGELYQTHTGYQIGVIKETYDDGEPVYISKYNKIFNFLGNPFIDLSNRIFDEP